MGTLSKTVSMFPIWLLSVVTLPSCGRAPGEISILLEADGTVKIAGRLVAREEIRKELEKAAAPFPRDKRGIVNCPVAIQVSAPGVSTWEQLYPVLEACARAKTANIRIEDVNYLMPDEPRSKPSKWQNARLLTVSGESEIDELSHRLKDLTVPGGKPVPAGPVPLVLHVNGKTRVTLLLATLRLLQTPDLIYWFAASANAGPEQIDIWIDDGTEPPPVVQLTEPPTNRVQPRAPSVPADVP